MLKVSVIVPTYRPSAGIDRLVASLDQQTMPTQDFEIILVDDASPDDTWKHLERIRDTRPNVRIHQLETNSGWPSRPRNIGIGLARGEYLLFADHDDEIYPDGLRAAYDYAHECGADVVNPKQMKTSDPRWGLADFPRDAPNGITTRGINALLPMVPHKLYRREFLLTHGIRYPEGRRKLWEDIYVNVECFRHAEVISVLSSTPVYLWHSTGQNNSGTYGPWEESFWDRLEELFVFIARTLPGPSFDAARTTQFVHHYRGRVLGRLTSYLTRSDPCDAWDRALTRAHRIMDEFLPKELDSRLPPLLRIRAALLRSGRLDLLAEQARTDQLDARSRVDEIGWQDGRLRIQVTTRWQTVDGSPLRLHERNGRLYRRLPDSVAGVVGVDALDLTDAVASATVDLTARCRDDSVTWTVSRHRGAAPERSSVAGDDLDVVTPVASACLWVDPETAAMGGRLGAGVWDLRINSNLGGAVSHHRLPFEAGPGDLPAMVTRGAVVAYRTKNNMWSIDLSGRLRNIIDTGGPVLLQRSGRSRIGWSGPLVVGLPAVATESSTAQAVAVSWEPQRTKPSRRQRLHRRLRRLSGVAPADRQKGPPLKGELRASPSRVELLLPLPRATGRFRGRVVLDGTTSRTTLSVTLRHGRCVASSIE
jgi:Glycosyl transferase family 2/Glycosyl transferase TarS linker domain